MTFPPGLWASTAAQVLLQGMEVTVTPHSLRWQIRSRYATLELKGDTTSRAASRTLFFCFQVCRSPGSTSRLLLAISMHPAAFPRTTASCTGRVSVDAAGDVQFRIPTPNTRCWAESQCTSSSSSFLLARCSSGDWVSKLLIHLINDSCPNPKGGFWFPSPEREQGCSPVPLAHPEGASTPGSLQHSVGDTH